MTAPVPSPSEQIIIDGFGIDHPTPKTEDEIREWKVELTKELDAHSDIPTMATALRAAVDTLTWVLGEHAA